jgi:PST family polysaccharide transporter
VSTDRRKILFGVVWSAAGNWGRQFLSLLILVVTARLLSPAEIGLFAVAAILTMLKEGSLDWAMNETVVRHPELTEQHLCSALWFSVMTGCALAVLVIACSHWIGSIYGEPLVASLLAVTTLSYPLGGALAVYEAKFRRDLDFRILALRPLAALSLAGAVGITMIHAGFGVWALVAQQITEKAVSLAMLAAFSRWRPQLSISRAHLRTLVPDFCSLAGAQLVGQVGRQFDRVAISLFFTPAILGAYALGWRILETTTALLLQGVNRVAYVLFARLQQDEAQLQRALNMACECTAMLAVPAFVGLSVLATDLVPLLFGEQWTGTGQMMQVLILAGIPQVIAGYLDSVTRATGHRHWYLANKALGTAAVVAFVLSTVQFGPTVVAASPLVGETVSVAVGLLILTRRVNVPVARMLRGLIPVFVAVAVMAIVLQAIRPDLLSAFGPVPALLFCVVLGVVVYAPLILLMARSSLSRTWALVRALR